MKTLKLDHHLVEAVKLGIKTSTWRLFDDKDLSVNDQVSLIDKVDPKKPETWHPFATARIDTVIQKRLGDINENDYQGNGSYKAAEDRIAEFRQYYGPNVNAGTPVKIIHFSLLPKAPVDAGGDNITTYITEVNLYADGGSRGNPGPSASGYAIFALDGRMVVKKGMYLGVTTNNQAEYQALKLGMEEALAMHVKEVHVYMDSLLVINQMLGIFNIKNRDLWPIHDAIRELLPKFRKISFTHVPRELNKVADQAVNEALDEALKV